MGEHNAYYQIILGNIDESRHLFYVFSLKVREFEMLINSEKLLQRKIYFFSLGTMKINLFSDT